MNMVQSPKPTTPELLAPAGDRDCLLAAIENGADAVYFGLQTHNARARAANFDADQLPEIMTLLHRRGVRGYVALNTLVFPSELPALEAHIRTIAASGVDAVIVQDIGLCRLILAVSPDLEIHASTQMSISSAAGVRMAESLGCSRVILARELSTDEIATIRGETNLPVEVFVHGALCVAYSGQCLTSEALGARSANRGECAQACRMAYSIVCDGADVDLGDIQYLLSPQDLAAYDLVPQLVALGVASLKIEGRLKSPEYVANITRQYRRAIDAAVAGRPAAFTPDDVREMELSFSRGFSHGFLDGNDHKILVRGDYAKKRGLFLGEVVAVSRNQIRLRTEIPIKPGDGLVFDAFDRFDSPEQGGRVFEVAGTAPLLDLGFDSRAIDLSKIHAGQRAWKTDDPALGRRLRATFEGAPQRLVSIDVSVKAHEGRPLALAVETGDGRRVHTASDAVLPAARTQAATTDSLRLQFDRLGGSIYRLGRFEAEIAGTPLVPASMLNALRRSAIDQLDRLASVPPPTIIHPDPALPGLRARDRAAISPSGSHSSVGPVALCRTIEQALAALAEGANEIDLDFQHIKDYRAAIIALRASGDVRIWLAPPRIEKPGESPIFHFLAKQGADGLLARNAGSVAFCVEHEIPFVADFSLNAANDLAVAWLIERGAERVTASYDLSLEQLLDLARASDASRLEVVVHQHMPMFHMEHCVYCAFLSPGHDKTDCGRPCDQHDVRLRDRVGMEHPLVADVGCRNTLFNAVPQSAAEFLPRLQARGVRHFRVEFLNDSPAAVRDTLRLYRDALEGKTPPHSLWKTLRATNRYGVTRGQLAVIQ